MHGANLCDASDTSVGGTHAMFIVRGDPRAYNLPPKPEVPTIYLKKGWIASALAGALLLGGSLAAFLLDGQKHQNGRNRTVPGEIAGSRGQRSAR